MTLSTPSRVSPSQPSQLTIGCFATLCAGRLGEELLRLSEAQPNRLIGVQEMGLSALLPALRAGRIDLAILPEGADPTLKSRPLWTDYVRVAISSEHALARKPELEAKDLEQLLFLVSRHQYGGELHHFLSARVTNAKLRTDMRDCDREALMKLVAHGKGAVFITEAERIEEKGISSLAIKVASACFKVCACWLDPASLTSTECDRVKFTWRSGMKADKLRKLASIRHKLC